MPRFDNPFMGHVYASAHLMPDGGYAVDLDGDFVECVYCGTWTERRQKETRRPRSTCETCGAPLVLVQSSTRNRDRQGIAIITIIDGLTGEERRFVFEDGRVPEKAFPTGM